MENVTELTKENEFEFSDFDDNCYCIEGDSKIMRRFEDYGIPSKYEKYFVRKKNFVYN